jgi:hypothetical protein
MMNALVGTATGIAMKLCGLGDPILWGVMAFLLNYIPILGPMTGVVIFFLVGIVSFDWPWYAFVPAGIYLLIHIAEGETITPMLLAKRFILNPGAGDRLIVLLAYDLGDSRRAPCRAPPGDLQDRCRPHRTAETHRAHHWVVTRVLDSRWDCQFAGLASLLFAGGGALRIWPVFALGNRFSGLVAIQPGHTLVMTGVNGVVRHPSYLGLLVNSLGWAPAFRSGVGVLLTAALIPPLVARIRAEEAPLHSQFGGEYDVLSGPHVAPNFRGLLGG